MIARAAALALATLLAAPALADPLERSPIPRLRADLAPKGAVPGLPRMLPVFAPPADAPRPRPRPVRAAAASPGSAAAAPTAPQATGLTASPHPRARPALPPVTPARAAAIPAAQPIAAIRTARDGAVCGDKAIRGVELETIPGTLKGCGIRNPVRVSMVDGVALSTPATIDCDTAKALADWVEDGLKPAVGRLGGGVGSLKVAASYSCRTRNNQPGAKISEHGKGRAIDIAAITLKNGTVLDVKSDWNTGPEGKLLKKVHAEACGPFGTVLGPEADRYHKDHFHFDTASYRGGAYCR